jgi:hypothetical protein
MTQHNAALVEQTNAAIEQTEAQASELDKVVATFTIAERPARHAAPALVAAPTAPPAKGIRGMQEKVKQAARSYLSSSAAAKDEWSEF